MDNGFRLNAKFNSTEVKEQNKLINVISHVFHFNFHLQHTINVVKRSSFHLQEPNVCISVDNYFALLAFFDCNLSKESSIKYGSVSNMNFFITFTRPAESVITAKAEVTFSGKEERLNFLISSLKEAQKCSFKVKQTNEDKDSLKVYKTIFSTSKAMVSKVKVKVKNSNIVEAKVTVLELTKSFDVVSCKDNENEFLFEEDYFYLERTIQPQTTFTFCYFLENRFRNIADYRFDSSRGQVLPATVVFNLNETIISYSQHPVLHSPLPDFSMSYNVMTLSLTILSFYTFGLLKVFFSV